MALVFLDTSALTRRYFVLEPGTDRIKALMKSPETNRLVISRLASVEFSSGLARRVREGAFGEFERKRLWTSFMSHLQADYDIIPVADGVVAEAERLTVSHALRALDAVQLASALIAGQLATLAGEDFRFVTADRKQAAAARDLGLETDFVG